ncbi:aspartate kinase [Alkalibacter rhizosphaerae]|uniref:Aspartokinase n=1 Tax=Alkalibacter rhizosphaerae TaxID=2815577 RepID=A0A975AIA6_9FIRM|nr:aspartate kinase [Alkalibacter rhizosphaerae]QSX08484.1 aspartate kinase [Alkalibacter rhizosphaerae]
MNIVVQKYGGSSVGDIERIQRVAKRIIKKKEEGFLPVVVVSAMGDNTDILLDMAYQISSNPPKREIDMLISTGEQVSIALLSMALQTLGHDAISLTGPQVGIKTEGHHTKSRIADIDDKVLRKHLENNRIIIVAGFQGSNQDSDITTLGRGGSDTTAVALAGKLQCPCEIYTDVDGIYSLDPRMYSNAKKLDTISYEEMLEMASLGAGVMHTRAIELAQKYRIPILVASSMEEKPGTIIKESEQNMESAVITGLAIDNNDVLITLNNVPYSIAITAEIFDRLAKKDINIDMISQTSPKDHSVNISFTTPKGDLEDAKSALQLITTKFQEISTQVNDKISKLSVVGIGMRSHSGVAAQIFVLLAKANIEVQMVTTSEIKISYVIDPKDQQKAVELIASEFDL